MPTNIDLRDEPPRQSPELIVFRSCEAARFSGFAGQTHPLHPHMRAWWPDLGEASLMCRPLARVTITERVRLSQKMRAILRAKQAPFGIDAIWIEL